ncbi:MAG: geranylgeranyl reductase family protein [Anaerolineae bacterium]|nr:geranylgeranyl reductase family protein [Anaerolineae bacterium]
MIKVKVDRCGYCGACVGVCPVGAIELAETRLLINEACFDCGLCLAACPVGALKAEGYAETDVVPLRRRYDVVVVGAGPGGSVAAREAAKLGLSVLLLEKRQEIGSPVRCAEGVAHELLMPFIEPDPHWISAEATKAQITVIDDGTTVARRAEGGKGYVLERRVFDRVLAEEAATAGAQVMVKTAATGLLLEDGVVRGVVARGLGGAMEIECAVVIGADGVESQVGPWAGLDTALSLRDTMACAQYLLAGIEIDSACCYYYVGQGVAPGGYAWVFPKGEGKANVGLGVQADVAADSALNYLTRFIEGQPNLAQGGVLSLSKGSPVTLVVGGVPVAPPLPRLVTSGLMLVGDAARQVDPLTGGGIANAMLAGRLAAEVAAQAIAAGDASADALAPYEKRWVAGRGRKMARNYRLKERFGPGERSSADFLRVFAVAIGAK